MNDQIKIPAGHWIDLGHDFAADTLYWPTALPFKHETVFRGITSQGFYCAAYTFSAAEHGGTHCDAPAHYAAAQPTIEGVRLEQLSGPAAVFDVSAAALANRDYQVGMAEMAGWEAANGCLPTGAIVLLNTGYSRYWPNPASYFGTDRSGAAALDDLHFPGLHPEAARWLAVERGIRAIGLDTPSIDYGQSRLFESHRLLCDHGAVIFENLTNLKELPPRGAWVIALPMKIEGGSGAPLRIVARVE